MKRRENMPLDCKVSTLASAPAGVVPLVEIVGNVRVLIENHHGVTSYNLNEICIKIYGGSIQVVGERMEILCMSKERIIICGVISGVHLLRGEKA